MEKHQCVALFGTTEQPASAPKRCKVENLTVEVTEAGALRNVQYGGIELIRGVDFLVRDECWGTMKTSTTNSSWMVGGEDHFQIRHEAEVDDTGLSYKLKIEGEAVGGRCGGVCLTIEAEAEATKDLITNRLGFVVLHPLAGVVGAKAKVIHASQPNVEKDFQFPSYISPSQPEFDIQELGWTVNPGIKVQLSFTGEVFEMEDQRNWADASLKTYCRPLSKPRPYKIAAGETIKQEILVEITPVSKETNQQLTARTAQQGGRPAIQPLSMQHRSPTSLRLPKLAFALQPNWDWQQAATNNPAIIPLLQHLSVIEEVVVRINCCTENIADGISQCAHLVSKLAGGEGGPTRVVSVGVEVIVANDGSKARDQLLTVAEACKANGVSPANVFALPLDFLKSYQPEGPWPTGLSPEKAAALAADIFPNAEIGLGMLGNFTELNRCQPRLPLPNKKPVHFITHGITSIQHDASDSAVMQTLETLPHIYNSVHNNIIPKLDAGGKLKYNLCSCTISPRCNPAGGSLVKNPQQIRLCMAEYDPRQRGLFCCAWLIGMLATTVNNSVNRITIGAPTGPIGVLHTHHDDFQQPDLDHLAAGHSSHVMTIVYPVYHIIAALYPGNIVSFPNPLEGKVAILGLQCPAPNGGGTCVNIWIANLTTETIAFPLAKDVVGVARYLDAEHFREAVNTAEWFVGPNSKAPIIKIQNGGQLTLTAHAVFLLVV
eukprot:TRINITY_DN53732_c0_g1_i1.p1 TRINITY_DN53732_c0_g1~~TRINITY_DN53732_c0_g1_i1.p1  ORF type:complete len:716 (-),score=56.14 TRINITY_DN53732_c0_g1_i1:243-2390(-)